MGEFFHSERIFTDKKIHGMRDSLHTHPTPEFFCWLLCIPPFSKNQGAYALVINFNSLEQSTQQATSEKSSTDKTFQVFRKSHCGGNGIFLRRQSYKIAVIKVLFYGRNHILFFSFLCLALVFSSLRRVKRSTSMMTSGIEKETLIFRYCVQLMPWISSELFTTPFKRNS